jgi:eukaryotic-like serine/threonine-protein kinase
LFGKRISNFNKMSLSRFFASRFFFKHLLFAFLLLAILIFITMKGLERYTLHGQSYPVPDFSGMLPADAEVLAKENNLRTEIVDSLFLDDADPGVVVDQVPAEGHGVKSGRTIFLTINSTLPEMVTLPQLTDISIRQAQVLVENSGLQIGAISYQPSEFNNLVLNVQIDSTDIFPGEQLPKGTRIDLVVGREHGNQTISLPDLKGLALREAKAILTDNLLNSGVILYDGSVITSEDSLNARIWRQRPDPEVTTGILLGSSVDLWVTVDELKLEFITDRELR